MTTKPRNENEPPEPVDVEKTKWSARPIWVASLVIIIGGFVINSTVAVASFMHETRSFQSASLEDRKELTEAIRSLTKHVQFITDRQNNVIADRWRFSDMQPWTYQLERMNRNIVREDGNKGLIVPEPVAKQPAPQP